MLDACYPVERNEWALPMITPIENCGIKKGKLLD